MTSCAASSRAALDSAWIGARFDAGATQPAGGSWPAAGVLTSRKPARSPGASAGWRGQHCQPIALGGDRLAALYVHRHDPPSIRLVLSDDFGRSWDRDNELVVYASGLGVEAGHATDERAFEDFWQDMMAWRFGHPRGVLLPDGDLFIAYYAGTAEASTMEWVRVGE